MGNQKVHVTPITGILALLQYLRGNLSPSPHDPTVLVTNKQLDLGHILKTGIHEARSSLFKV